MKKIKINKSKKNAAKIKKCFLGAPMILVDGFNVDYDTVSIVSSITTPHMYKCEL